MTKIFRTLTVILKQITSFLKSCACEAQAEAELKEDKKLFTQIEQTICDLRADLACAQVMRARLIKDRPSLVQKTDLNQKAKANNTIKNWAI